MKENWYFKAPIRMEPTGSGLCKSVLEPYLDRHAPHFKLDIFGIGSWKNFFQEKAISLLKVNCSSFTSLHFKKEKIDCLQFKIFGGKKPL